MAAHPRLRRSDTTRARIRDAARDRFAADGYERATIRVIAADAGIDPSMVMRYFGSKEKLFAAAAEFDLRLPDLRTVPRADVGAALVAHFLDRWEGDETLLALLRTAVTHDAAAERMRAIFADQLAPLLTSICPEPGAAPVRAGLVASQMLGLALCRYVLQLPPVSALGRGDVVAWVAPTIQRYISGRDATAAAVEPRLDRPQDLPVAEPSRVTGH